MLVYHSAFSLAEEYARFLEGRQVRILRSYHTTKSTLAPFYCSGIFLDSGAFSAFRSDAYIDLDGYIAFLRDAAGAYDAYAGLDVIGDPKATYQNQRRMESHGLTPVPTFHVGEKFKWLERYLSRNQYVALGGMVPYSGTLTLHYWLERCWEVIERYDDVRIHGFGLTDLTLARRYPWYSIDSTTASRAGRSGVLVTPWGQLRVSKAIKTRTSATIDTPKKIETVHRWLEDFVPGLVSSWDMIAEPTKEASQLRIAINARFIEHVAEKPTRPGRKNPLGPGYFQ